MEQIERKSKVVFNVAEVSEYLHVSKSSVRKMVRTKTIPFYKVLSRIFFDKDTIDVWIQNQQLNNFNMKEVAIYE